MLIYNLFRIIIESCKFFGKVCITSQLNIVFQFPIYTYHAYNLHQGIMNLLIDMSYLLVKEGSSVSP